MIAVANALFAEVSCDDLPDLSSSYCALSMGGACISSGMTTKLLLRLLEDLDNDADEARSKAPELPPLPVKILCHFEYAMLLQQVNYVCVSFASLKESFHTQLLIRTAIHQ